jgi:hypothetical protein
VEKTIELLEKLMERKEVKESLKFLHSGIGTATEERIYLDLETHLAELKAKR